MSTTVTNQHLDMQWSSNLGCKNHWMLIVLIKIQLSQQCVEKVPKNGKINKALHEDIPCIKINHWSECYCRWQVINQMINRVSLDYLNGQQSIHGSVFDGMMMISYFLQSVLTHWVREDGTVYFASIIQNRNSGTHGEIAVRQQAITWFNVYLDLCRHMGHWVMHD